MADSPRPYIASCPLCEQGLVRAAVCSECGHLAAVCDECEAIWKDPRAFAADHSTKPEAQHPECPACRQKVRKWGFMSREELEDQALAEFIVGESP